MPRATHGLQIGMHQPKIESGFCMRVLETRGRPEGTKNYKIRMRRGPFWFLCIRNVFDKRLGPLLQFLPREKIFATIFSGMVFVSFGFLIFFSMRSAVEDTR